MQKTFYIVDDHETMRLGIVTYITAHSDWRCSGNSADVETALAELERFARTGTMPAVVICDLAFGDEDLGFDLVKRIHELYPHQLIIVHSMYLAPGIAQSAIQNGASGYVSKSAPSDKLLQCMEHVLAGEVVVPDDMQEKLEQLNSFYDALTKRERNVMDLLLRNMSNGQIADTLNLKQRAVNNYISSIYEKTGIDDRSELIRLFS